MKSIALYALLFMFCFLFIACDNPFLKKTLEPLFPEECKVCVYDYVPTRTCTTVSKKISIDCPKHKQHIGYSETVAPLPHSISSWTPTTPATCTTTGIETGSCSNCGGTITHPIPAFGHSWGNWTVTTTTYPAQSNRTCVRSCTDTARATTIGDTGPGGGIVFYDKGNNSDGWCYLEAAPTDQATSITWCTCNGSPWCNVPTSTAIGTGKANTDAIIAAHSSDTIANNAAKAAHITIGGKNDWFLPSKDELDEMYNAQSHLGISSGYFWSSSQSGNRYAWSQHFGDGGQGDLGKDDGGNVRAVRAF